MKKNTLLHVLMVSAMLISSLAVSPASAGAPAAAPVVSSANVHYVRPYSNGDCSSWDEACDLQTALANATSGDEIWVAAGVYYPGITGNRLATFQLKNGVGIYGGFAGTETARSQRDWILNPTILSGDINRDGNLDGNAYHVVTGSGTDATAILDGFTITAGNADGSGGGMYNDGGSPTLANLIFSGNYAWDGGGMANYYSSPSLTDVTFYANTAGDRGGGMHNFYSNPVLTGVTFSANTADLGGGVENAFSDPTLTNVTFSSNVAGSYSGGMHNFQSNTSLRNVVFSDNEAGGYGGAMHIWQSTNTLVNVTFANNSAANGGGISIGGPSTANIANSIFWGNEAATEGDQIYKYDDGTTVNVTYSIVQGGYTGTSNLNLNPSFIDADRGNLRLLPTSPAIDVGSNAAVSVTTDLDGSPRIVNFTGSGTPTVDMGAYEAQLAGSIIYVDKDAPGPVHDGNSWNNAFRNLQSGLAAANGEHEIWVAAGVYVPGITGNRLATFQLKNELALYGGFAGTETARSQRDWILNPTILSGDIDRDGNLDGNAYHVVTGSGTDATAILDGFTITAGNADGSGGGMYNDGGSSTLQNLTFTGNSAAGSGGGMWNNNSSPTLTNVAFSANSAQAGGGMYNGNSSLTLTDVTFSANSAGSGGGGIYNDSSSLTLMDATFSANTTNQSGGGIFNYDSSGALTNVTFTGNSAVQGGGMANGNSSPILTNVTFSGNSADHGGGMSNWNNSNPSLTGITFSGNSALFYGGGMFNGNSSPSLTNVTFTGNSAVYFGGGISNQLGSNPSLTGVTFSGNSAEYYGGGMDNDNSSSTLTNVTFSGNSAVYGGGLCNFRSSATLTNVTFSGNTADYGGGIYNENSNPILTNAILWGNTAPDGPQIFNHGTSTTIVAYSIVQGGYAGDNNLDEDPRLGDLADNGGATLTHALLPGSPAIDAGHPDTCPSADQRGQPRPVDGNGDGQAVCDIGAYEFPAHTTTTLAGHQPDPSQAGAPFTVSFAVTSASGTPTGIVTVTVSDSPASCSANLVSGLGSCQLTLAEPGLYTLTATYGGAAGFAPSSDTDSHTVVAAVTTTTITGHQPDPSQAGEPFTVTFAVTSTVGTPTGAVTVTVSGSPASCSANLVSGLGSCQLTLSEPGLYTLTATYGGAAGFAPSSDTDSHTVVAAATRLYLPMVVR